LPTHPSVQLVMTVTHQFRLTHWQHLRVQQSLPTLLARPLQSQQQWPPLQPLPLQPLPLRLPALLDQAHAPVALALALVLAAQARAARWQPSMLLTKNTNCVAVVGLIAGRSGDAAL
jgi:hypothetical protein